jgi:gluconolactonase
VSILRTLTGTVLMLLWAAAAVSAADPIFPEGAQPELLWSEGEFTEGVVSSPEGQIYFSDIPAKVPGRILKFDPKSRKTTVHSADSGKSNGLTFDAKGNLIACCGAGGGVRAVCQVSASGALEPIVSSLTAKRSTLRTTSTSTRKAGSSSAIHATEPQTGWNSIT